MGKWERQYIIVEPGERDVRSVAGHLRASLAWLDCPGIDDPERDVTVRNGRVHWDSHERLTGPWKLLRDIHTDLDVPCKWIVGVIQHEVEHAGGASLFTWVDGDLVPVEETPTTNWIGDRAGLRLLKQQWGIDPAFEPDEALLSPLSNQASADRDNEYFTAGPPPLASFAAELRDEPIETRELARAVLAATPADVLASAVDTLTERIDRGDRSERIDALEQLYAAATSSVVPVEVTPRPVLDLLDETGRSAMLAAAVVRELTTEDAVSELTSDTPEVRRQAARYLGLVGAPKTVDDSMIEALTDEDPHVRVGVARALFKRVWSQLDRTSVVDGEVSESDLFESLSNGVDDDDPRVRSAVAPALALLAVHHDSGDEAVALSAIASGLDGEPATRRSVEWLLGTYFWSTEGDPSSVAAVTAAAIPALGEQIEHLARDSGLFDTEVIDAAVAQLTEEGWDPADADIGTLAAICTVTDGPFEAADRIGRVLLDRLATNPLEATEALVAITECEPASLDEAVAELAVAADSGSPAATEALARIASAHPELIRDHWDTVRPALVFDGDQARPAAAVVAALAAEDPDAGIPTADATRDVVSNAISTLYGFLDAPDEQAREEVVRLLVSLGSVGASPVPSGIEPFVDRSDGKTDGGDGPEHDPIEDRDVLAVVAERDPDAATEALSSLLSTLDPSDDSRQFRTVIRIIEDQPAVAIELVDRLVEFLARPVGREHPVAAAIAAAAEHDPAAVEPHVGTLLTCLADFRSYVHAAEALAAVEAATPGTLPQSLADLTDAGRGEDWPVDVLAASRPHLVDRMVRDAVAAERSRAADFLATVTEYRPETAQEGVTRLVERADSVGYNSHLWSTLEGIAESKPELAAVGLDEIVENTVESVDARMGRGRKPARPLVVLAEQYPRRTWALLERYDPESDPTTLPDRARRSRVEEKLEAILDAAGPEASLSEGTETEFDGD